MPRFFIDSVFGDAVTLDGENAKHISRSLRMKVGETITISDGNKMDYFCEITEINSENVFAKVLYKQESEVEPSVEVNLYQGVPKGDKMDDIVQKLVEIGVHSITPVLTSRSVSRPDEKSSRKKNERYQKIAVEAAKQCGRGILPQVKPMVSFKEALQTAQEDVKIIFYEGGGESLSKIVSQNNDAKSFGIFIGPEGGFEKGEVDALLSNGGVKATLGKRILRTQTAPIVAVTGIMLFTKNLE